VPLVAQGEECVLTKLAIEALDRAGREWEMAFSGPNSSSVAGAVAAGLGISAMVERLVPPELTIWRDAPLPPLPDIPCGIYLRESHDRGLLEELAEALAKAIRPPPASAASRGSVSDRQAG
jgi:DNA-binding transcriptional LysR family regulator